MAPWPTETQAVAVAATPTPCVFARGASVMPNMVSAKARGQIYRVLMAGVQPHSFRKQI